MGCGAVGSLFAAHLSLLDDVDVWAFDLNELHDDPWSMNVLATERGHRHFPSMLEDVEAKRPTELESINGALVREAWRLGVDVPLQTAVYRLVKAREASYSE